MKIKPPSLLAVALALLHSISFNTSVAQTSPDSITAISAALPVIDNMVRDYAAKNHFPGMVYGIVMNGKLIHTGTAGFTALDKKTEVTARSAFRIASMTKSFTAMAILLLRDQGRLTLEDPVYAYIPEMKAPPYLTADAPPITIRHLLTHAAGFPEDNPWGDRQLAVSDEAMMAMIKKGISFSNVPGVAYEYSNMGFAMLGFIIKKVSGEPYEEYLTKHILLPLGMTHTYWDYGKVPADELAHGYRWLNGNWSEQPLLKDGAYGAMGGLITSIEDFGKYVALHLSAWPPASGKETGPVKRSAIREMQHAWNVNQLNPDNTATDGRKCPVVSAYGYGLRWTKDCNNRVIVGHSGGLPGFGSDWKILPDYGIGIICFGNLTYAPAGAVNLRALDTLITLAKLKPRQLPVSAILNQRKNELIQLLPDWNNAAASGIFAENFFMDYMPDSLKKEARAIFGKAGRIVGVKALVPVNNLRGSFIMEGTNTDITISFTLTPENPALIQEYHIKEKPKE